VPDGPQPGGPQQWWQPPAGGQPGQASQLGQAGQPGQPQGPATGPWQQPGGGQQGQWHQQPSGQQATWQQPGQAQGWPQQPAQQSAQQPPQQPAQQWAQQSPQQPAQQSAQQPPQQPAQQAAQPGAWAPPTTPDSGGWQAQQQPAGGFGQQVPGVPSQPGRQDRSGQQFGGGFQPSQYGGLGAFSAEAVRKAPRPKRPLVIGGGVVAVVVVGGVVAWLLGAFQGDTLEQKSLQDGVSRVLNQNYGEPDVKNVQCPSGEAVDNGTTFDCSVQIGGQPKKVTVRVLNDKPEYSVGAPH
jgi:hypothetical protein